MEPVVPAPVIPQGLSLTYRAFLYKISYEGLRNAYSVGSFVVICLFVAVVLLMLCNFLIDISCRKSPDRKRVTNVAPPKRSQIVYSSMLPPREDFVLMDMDVAMKPNDTQTPKQVEEGIPAPQGKVRNKAIRIRAEDIRRFNRAKGLKRKRLF